MANGNTGFDMAPGYKPLEHLSPEELDYWLKQHETSAADTKTLTDEELNSLLQNYEAPGGNINPDQPPVVDTPPPVLTGGEELAGGLREVAGGAAFEFADEAEAAARAPFSSKSYEQILKDIRLERAKFGEAHPYLAPALNVAGGVGSMFIPGVGAVGKGIEAVTGVSKLASPVARVAANSALAGGVSGLGSGEDMQSRLSNAAVGGVLGAGLGTAVHGVAQGAKWLNQARKARGAGQSEEEAAQHATDIINRRMEEGGVTPDQARQLWELEQQYGIPSVLGTVTPELGRLTENVVQTPSAGRADLAELLFRQQSAAPSRIASKVKQAVPTPDYFASEDSITSALRRNADSAYENAYAAGDVSDGRIMDFLKAPDVQAAYKDALANAERLKEAAKLRGEDPSRYNLRELFVADPQGNIVQQNVPDIRTLDYVKQALDRRISGLYASGQGGEASALREMRNAFVDTLDVVGPAEYRAARQQYKGDIEIRDALEQGRKSNSLRWQEFNKLMRGYTPGEQQAFKTGFVQNIMQRFENTGTSRNFAKDLLKGNDIRKFEAIMDPGEFAAFQAALQRESDMFGNLGRITQGSATFGRAAEKADIESQIAGGNVEGALDVLLNPTPGNILKRTLQVISGMRNANVSRATYTQLARMLKAGTPDEVDDVLRQLEEAGPAQQATAQASEGRVTRTGAGLASSVAPPPEDTRNQLPSDVEVNIPSLDEGPSGLSAMPISGSAGDVSTFGNEAGSGGTSDILDAVMSLLPDFQGGFADGSIVGSSGASLSGEQVAKALGLPYEIYLALWNR